ncbi:MAG: biotin/lipoyl-binding protein, partial [Methylophilaceae bacterium]|nr:biotin/lipoyl-binding protein [Methylophilaceae bacterium]
MSFRYRWEATRELWRRYKEVVKYFWQRRKEMDLPALSEEESEFLPAALSLQTKPVSPVGRWSARILMALFTAIVLWAVFGHVDVIVNSNGKIIPFGQPKTIASIEVAKVTALYVQEGQYVKAGQVLLELDTRIPDSERDKAEGERQLVRLQVLRCQTFLRSIDTNQDPVLPKLDGIPEDKQLQEAQHLREQWLEFSSKRGRLRGEISRLSQILPLLT